jgi:hypothetical protein
VSIGQNTAVDYLEMRNNIFSADGDAQLQDFPSSHRDHLVVDDNVYHREGGRPMWTYVALWNFNEGPGQSGLQYLRDTFGWEQRGQEVDPQLNDPARGDLDYPPGSTLRGAVLDDPLGDQMGARGLDPAPVWWSAHPLQAIAASGGAGVAHLTTDRRGTWWTGAKAYDQWITYDLGEARTFRNVILGVRGHNLDFNVRSFHIQVSDDATTWRTVHSGVNPDRYMPSFRYELSEPATARYVRFYIVETFRRSVRAQFTELEVGNLLPVPPPPPAVDSVRGDGSIAGGNTFTFDATSEPDGSGAGGTIAFVSSSNTIAGRVVCLNVEGTRATMVYEDTDPPASGGTAGGIIRVEDGATDRQKNGRLTRSQIRSYANRGCPTAVGYALTPIVTGSITVSDAAPG